MTQINLLPWREQARKERKIQFFLSIGVFAGLALFVIFLLHIYFAGLISFQNSRNVFLQTSVDQENAAIAGLDKKKEDLVKVHADLNFIFSLREKSYRAVSLLDHIENLIPEGVTLRKIARTDKLVIVVGVAKSNLQVTDFMKNLEKSSVFSKPTLTQLNVGDEENNDQRQFEIKVELKG